MKAHLFLLSISLVILPLAPIQAAPALHVLRHEHGSALLPNGDFEQFDRQTPVAWRAAPGGFQVVEQAGRNGSHALFCQNDTNVGWLGASQTLALNRRTIAPLIVRGWSKAEDVSGGSDSDYSLYVDLVYTDGTPLWGSFFIPAVWQGETNHSSFFVNSYGMAVKNTCRSFARSHRPVGSQPRMPKAATPSCSPSGSAREPIDISTSPCSTTARPPSPEL